MDNLIFDGFIALLKEHAQWPVSFTAVITDALLRKKEHESMGIYDEYIIDFDLMEAWVGSIQRQKYEAHCKLVNGKLLLKYNCCAKIIKENEPVKEMTLQIFEDELLRIQLILIEEIEKGFRMRNKH